MYKDSLMLGLKNNFCLLLGLIAVIGAGILTPLREYCFYIHHGYWSAPEWMDIANILFYMLISMFFGIILEFSVLRWLAQMLGIIERNRFYVLAEYKLNLVISLVVAVTSVLYGSLGNLWQPVANSVYLWQTDSLTDLTKIFFLIEISFRLHMLLQAYFCLHQNLEIPIIRFLVIVLLYVSKVYELGVHYFIVQTILDLWCCIPILEKVRKVFTCVVRFFIIVLMNVVLWNHPSTTLTVCLIPLIGLSLTLIPFTIFFVMILEVRLLREEIIDLKKKRIEGQFLIKGKDKREEGKYKSIISKKGKQK